MVAARRRSASSGPLRGLQRHVRRRVRSCVQSNLPAMPTIGEGGLIPPISGQSPPEKANIVKVAGNLMLATVIESFGEAFALVRKAGIDPKAFYDVVTSGLFAAPAYKGYGRLILDQAYEPPGFTLKLGLKDVDFALAAGHELNVPLPLGSLLRDHFLEAIAKGYGEKDWVAMAEVSAEHAGLGKEGRA